MRRFFVLIAVLVLSGCGGAEEQSPLPEVRAEGPAEWVTHQDVDRSYTVAYPADWTLAPDRLTPNLADPKEILAIATYDPPVGGNRCSHQPVAAVEALGPGDALIVVFERRPPWPKGGYPRRETIDLALERGTGRFCVPDQQRLDAWLSFRDAGRAFYLLVAVGPEASNETRRSVDRIVESLTFEPA
jgi:hypothetical protein